MTLNELQKEVGEWAYENFGEQPAHWCIKGAIEELGELFTSDLKTDQGLADTPKYQKRGTVGPEAERDAIGDVVIYLMDYCYRSGLDFDFDYLIGKRWEGTSKEESLAQVSRGLGLAHSAAVKGRPKNIIRTGIRYAVRGLRLYCDVRGYDFEQCVYDAADEVLDRDWNAERAKA